MYDLINRPAARSLISLPTLTFYFTYMYAWLHPRRGVTFETMPRIKRFFNLQDETNDRLGHIWCFRERTGAGIGGLLVGRDFEIDLNRGPNPGRKGSRASSYRCRD
jgi:hypothetical protein